MNARTLLVVVVVTLALSSATVSGCTGGPPKGPVSPGVDAAALGGAEVVGYLISADGAWAVLDADPSASGSEPKVIAILVPGSVDEGGIAALSGRYIWAAGPSSDGNNDALTIKVDGIDTAVEPE